MFDVHTFFSSLFSLYILHFPRLTYLNIWAISLLLKSGLFLSDFAEKPLNPTDFQ